ncbi:hypothetical protein Esti_004542 [Eimeria stiedai]
MLGRRRYCRYRFSPPIVPEKWIQSLDKTGLIPAAAAAAAPPAVAAAGKWRACMQSKGSSGIGGASELLELLEREDEQQREETFALLELLQRQRRDIATLRQQQQQLQQQLEAVQLTLNEQRQQNQQLRRQLLIVRRLRTSEKQSVVQRLASVEAAFEKELETYFLPPRAQGEGGGQEGPLDPRESHSTFFSPHISQQQRDTAARKLMFKQQLRQQQQQQQQQQLLSSSTMSSFSPPSRSALAPLGHVGGAPCSAGPSVGRLGRGSTIAPGTGASTLFSQPPASSLKQQQQGRGVPLVSLEQPKPSPDFLPSVTVTPALSVSPAASRANVGSGGGPLHSPGQPGGLKPAVSLSRPPAPAPPTRQSPPVGASAATAASLQHGLQTAGLLTPAAAPAAGPPGPPPPSLLTSKQGLLKSTQEPAIATPLSARLSE